MKSYTEHLWFNTKKRIEFINITDKVQELITKSNIKEDFVLVDVLGTESFETKHVPTSKDIDVDEIEDRAETELPDKNKLIVVYCASTTCQASPTAAAKLEEMEYTNVVEFKSGLAGWEKAGFEFES